jgi:hypothetical protein
MPGTGQAWTLCVRAEQDAIPDADIRGSILLVLVCHPTWWLARYERYTRTDGLAGEGAGPASDSYLQALPTA